MICWRWRSSGRDDFDVLVATNGGFAKRTPIEEYPVQGRGGKGVLTAKITDAVADWSARS
jgi:DNA gyrase subunit A